MDCGRFERWLEMVLGSVLLVLAVWFIAALIYAIPHRPPSLEFVVAGFSLALVALFPVFQYAWTFFYLRLIELEEPRMQGTGPFHGSSTLGGPWHAPGSGPPQLKLVGPPPPDPDKSEGGTA